MELKREIRKYKRSLGLKGKLKPGDMIKRMNELRPAQGVVPKPLQKIPEFNPKYQ
jgi:hypothetical protein